MAATTTWGDGEYPRMAQALQPVSDLIVESIPDVSGLRVADLACGTGNAAVAAASRGADVLGVDFEPMLLEIARSRSTRCGLRIDFRQGDLLGLPVPDAHVDVVVSVFGAMYAPDPSAALREIRRIMRQGASAYLCSWLPGSLLPATGGAFVDFLPPLPATELTPAQWSLPERIDPLCDAAGLQREETRHGSIDLTFSGLDEAADFFVETAGHIIKERPRLEREGRWPDVLDAMRATLAGLHPRDDDGHLVFEAAYATHRLTTGAATSW